MTWNDKHVLVTGGASFIGSHLVDRLLALGARVRVADDLSSGDLANLAGPMQAGDVEFQEVDLRSLEVCRRARRALERQEELPEGLPENLAAVVRQAEAQDRLPTGARYEMTSASEHKRFETMGRITTDELDTVDLDELANKLQS